MLYCASIQGEIKDTHKPEMTATKYSASKLRHQLAGVNRHVVCKLILIKAPEGG